MLFFHKTDLPWRHGTLPDTPGGGTGACPVPLAHPGRDMAAISAVAAYLVACIGFFAYSRGWGRALPWDVSDVKHSNTPQNRFGKKGLFLLDFWNLFISFLCLAKEGRLYSSWPREHLG